MGGEEVSFLGSSTSNSIFVKESFLIILET